MIDYLPIDSYAGGDRYRVTGVIGKGGFGAVYLVEDTEYDDRLLALKEVLSKFKDRDELECVEHMFYQEAGLLSSLKHPAIPGITDFFVENDRLYVAMEYIEGRTLADYIDMKIKPSDEEVIEFALQLTDVLSYLHNHKPNPVVFRDVKPENIMIGYDKRIYLIDFGLARLFDAAKKQDTIICLSQGYAPPEQYPAESGIPGAQGKTDTRADIYAFGATLHHLITGRDPRTKPFYFPPVRELNLNISQDLEDIISRCLEYSPDKRYENVDVIGEELLKIIKKKNFNSRKEDMYSLALKYEKEENFEESLFLYKELLELDPEDITLHYKIGKCYEKMGLFEMARKYLDCYGRQENMKKELTCPHCENVLKEPVNICPSCHKSVKLCMKCKILNRPGARFCRVCKGEKFDLLQPSKSKYKPVTLRLNIKLYKDAIKKFPGEAEYYLGLGETYDELDKPLRAVSSYQKYLSLMPEGEHRERIEKRVGEIKKTHDVTMVDSREWLIDSVIW